MFGVSDEYIAAMQSGIRIDKVYGRIFLKDGTKIDVDDSMIVQKSLSTNRRVFSGTSFDLGTFDASSMKISLRDKDALSHDYAGAAIVLRYSVAVAKNENGEREWEDVPLGVYYVDGQTTSRIGSVVHLKAYDSAAKFDVVRPDLSSQTTLYGAVLALCSYVGVGCATSEVQFNAFPNATITPDFSSEQIQSARDVIMWIAQTTGSHAMIDLYGRLVFKRYLLSTESTYDREITARQRKKIEFSDTKTYWTYYAGYSGGVRKNYYNKIQTADRHIKEGALSLPENPLIATLAVAQQDDVNIALLNGRSEPTRYIKAEVFSDPSIEPLDVLAFSGGLIDVGEPVLSVCTEITWKYRSTGTIICGNIEEYAEEAKPAADVALLSDDEEQVAKESNDTSSDDVIERVAPKSQMEKRLDALENSVRNNTTEVVKFLNYSAPAPLGLSWFGDGLRVAYSAGGWSDVSYIPFGMSAEDNLMIKLNGNTLTYQSGTFEFSSVDGWGWKYLMSTGRFYVKLSTDSGFTEMLTMADDGLYYKGRRLKFADE